MPQKKIPVPLRFWSCVDKTGDCWIWTGQRTRDGYGRISVNQKYVGAHRVSFELANGPIPDGLYVLHSCDNRPCVNPAHLWLGTHQDNMRDMAEKGRGRERGKGGINAGASNPRAKITEQQVSEIRALRGVVKHAEIAKRFGISKGHVSAIQTGARW